MYYTYIVREVALKTNWYSQKKGDELWKELLN